MSIITIVGAGMMGSALAFPARENGNEVRIVGTPLDRDIIETGIRTNRHQKFTRDFPSGISFYQIESLETALSGADLVIGGVSSFGVDWFGENVLPFVDEKTPILTVTKGLFDTEDGKLLTYPELWETRLAEKGISRILCAIGGPCTSYELVAHDQTHVAFCGKDPSVLSGLRDMLSTSYYHISLSENVRGIESAVALKNSYALGVALTIGLNQKEKGLDEPLHYNSQAAVFGQSLREMAKLLSLQDAYSLNNLSVGIGDLYVTVYGGRTRQIGILLGRGLSLEEATQQLSGVTLESLVVAVRVARAVKALSKAGKVNLADYPLLMHIDSILSNGAPADIPWESFTWEE